MILYPHFLWMAHKTELITSVIRIIVLKKTTYQYFFREKQVYKEFFSAKDKSTSSYHAFLLQNLISSIISPSDIGVTAISFV